MDKKNIIKSVQRQDEEKVGFSLKLPASLKTELQTLCETESISMNAIIVATLHSLISDDCGKELKTQKNLIIRWRDAINKEFDEIYSTGHIDTDIEAQQRVGELHATLKDINKILGL